MTVLTLLRRTWPVGIACLLTVTPAAGQRGHIAVGDTRVSGDRIQPYTAHWQMYHRTPDGTERIVGLWLDTMEVVTVDGQTLLRRSQVALDTAGKPVSRQVHLVDRETLAPVRSHFSAGGNIKHIDFGEETADGFVLAGEEKPILSFQAPVNGTTFDFEIAGTLLVGFAIRTSEQLTFETYDLRPTSSGANGFPNGFTLVTQSVDLTSVGVETVQAGQRGDVEAIRVVVERGRGTLTFWVSDAPPYIIRLTSESPNGTTIWSLR